MDVARKEVREERGEEAAASPLLSRRLFLAGSVAAVLGAVPVAEAYRFEVSRTPLRLPGLRAPLRVALLTDLHFGPFMREGSARDWVSAALHEKPDLILITGDFVDRQAGEDVRPLLAQLSRLEAPLGVWGVWGNHDYARFGVMENKRLGLGGPRYDVIPARADWEARRESFRADLAAAGVRVLRNEGVRVRDDLFLAGADDFICAKPDLGAALRGAGDGAASAAQASAAQASATLLMSHNPDLLPKVPQSVGLTLCGHTHGGQVRLPVIGALVTASLYGQRFARGLVHGPARGFVSRGLGVTTLPLRLRCPPELAVLDLHP